MPPISRTDTPYPLRTIDGEVDVTAATISCTDLDVTGTATVNNLFVSGITSIPGGVIDLANIVCDSLDVQGPTILEGTTTATGLATFNGGVSSTTMNTGNLAVSGNLTASGVAAGAAVIGTGGLLGSISNTGTGLNVLQTSPTLVNPALGSASGTSLSLTTPLGVLSGGTGQSSLSSVVVGKATNVDGGTTGQVVVQSGVGTTTFTGPGTTGQILTSTGGVPTFQDPADVVLTGGAGITGILPIANGGTGTTTLTVVTVGRATNKTAGAAGDILVQTAANTTSFVTPATAGNVLTSNGAGVVPSFQAVPATNLASGVTGVLPVLNGGTGVTGKTGTGFVVLNTTPTLTTPVINGGTGTSLTMTGVIQTSDTTTASSTATGSIITPGGIGVGGSVFAGGLRSTGNVIADSVVQASSAANATTTSSGAITAPNGGISCASDLFIGGRATVSSSTNSTSTTTGAIVTPGGLGVSQNINAGGIIKTTNATDSTSTTTGSIIATGGIASGLRIFAGGQISTLDTTNSTSSITGSITTPGGIGANKNITCGDTLKSFGTVNATSTSTGAVQSAGGIGCAQDVYAGGKITATTTVTSGSGFYIGPTYGLVNMDQGTFTPYWDTTSGTPISSITYVSQEGYYQNYNQWTHLYVGISWIVPVGMTTIRIAIGGIPGVYMTGAQANVSDVSQFNVGIDPFVVGFPLQPLQIFYDNSSGKWVLGGYNTSNAFRFADYVQDDGANYTFYFSGCFRRTTL